MHVRLTLQRRGWRGARRYRAVSMRNGDVSFPPVEVVRLRRQRRRRWRRLAHGQVVVGADFRRARMLLTAAAGPAQAAAVRRGARARVRVAAARTSPPVKSSDESFAAQCEVLDNEAAAAQCWLNVAQVAQPGTALALRCAA